MYINHNLINYYLNTNRELFKCGIFIKPGNSEKVDFRG